MHVHAQQPRRGHQEGAEHDQVVATDVGEQVGADEEQDRREEGAGDRGMRPHDRHAQPAFASERQRTAIASASDPIGL